MRAFALRLRPWVDVLGRITLVALFLGSATGHIMHWRATADLITQRGLPLSVLLVAAVIVVELGAGVAFLVGWRPQLAALALAAFTIVATTLFHLHPQQEVEMHLFFKDLAICGALLCFAVRPWPRAEGRCSTALRRLVG
jgi:putative oxidoreductase